MNDIEKIIKLYTMMSDRCERSGYAPRQGEIYREIADLIRNCTTAQEATEKIKNSKYYLAPSAALIQDKIGALEKAALENNMSEVATVYKEKLIEIDDDINSIYDSAYATKAHNLKIEYIQTLEAFATIYDSYIILSCCNIMDEVAVSGGLNGMKEALSKLTKPSFSFKELASLPNFRQLIPCNNQAYEKFVEEVSRISSQGLDFSTEKQEIQKEYDNTISAVSDISEKIKEIGKKNLSKVKLSQVLALAPDDKHGGYKYTDEAVTNFG